MDLFKPGRKIRANERTYEVVQPIGSGGSGIVYEVRLGGRRYAMKVFFPFHQLSLFQGSSAEFAVWINESGDFQRREHAFLSSLSHPNIVKVFDHGDVALQVQERKHLPHRAISQLPVLFTDLIDGLTLNKALEAGLSAAQLTFALMRLARALEYLHADKRYMHTDVKATNIIVRSLDFEPVLIDFALCKNLNFSEVSSSETTRLLGDWDLFPKELATDHRLKQLKESSGTREELFQLAFPALDLYQFGKLLQGIRGPIEAIYERRESDYLAALADQLTTWSTVSKWGSRDLAQRLDRLGTEHFATFGVPELVAPTTAERTITLPPGVGVPLTKQIERIVDSRSFRRLFLINQLSLLGYVYPGADYKRAVHVLFAYDLARQFVVHLYGVPEFRMLFDKRSVQQLLVTVLLHDINHFPFLHIFQESNVEGLKSVDVVDLFCNGEATGEHSAGQPSIYELMGNIGLEPDRFKRLVLSEHHKQEGATIEVDHTISSVINSGVDLDKLSYLFLDSYFTGVRYGAGLDIQTLLKAAQLGRKGYAGDGALHLAFDDRALQAVENVVMTRFWNFRSIYWHHTNRAMMAMILQVVRQLYVGHGRNVQDYLLDTLWLNDVEALRYLDRKYESQLGRKSVLSGVVEDRCRLYKRIYTVRAGAGDDIDDELHAKLRRLDLRSEVRFRRGLAFYLGDLLRPSLEGTSVHEDEVLIDVPRREMDSGGAVYLGSAGGTIVPLSQISEPVRAISGNYDRLTKRTRLFVAPRLTKNLSRDWRTKRRTELQKAIQTALEYVNSDSQVK